MSDIAKWALLVAGAVILIGMILALPFVDGIDLGQFSNLVGQLAVIGAPFFKFGRGLINNFFTPWGASLLTSVLIFVIGKQFFMMSIKILTWVYHFIFK